jgi:flagellar basal body-associated protein FliL
MIKMKRKIMVLVCVVALALSLPTLAFAAISPDNPAPATDPGSPGITFTPPATTEEAEPPSTEVVDSTTPSGPVAEAPSSGDTPEQIAAPDVPLTSGEPLAQWAVLNLVLAIISLIFSLVLIVTIFTGSSKNSDAKNGSTRSDAAKGSSANFWRALTIIVGIVSPIVFLLTEDWTLPMFVIDVWTPLMVVIDVWTPLMVVFVLMQVVLTFIMRQVRKNASSRTQADAT